MVTALCDFWDVVWLVYWRLDIIGYIIALLEAGIELYIAWPKASINLLQN